MVATSGDAPRVRYTDRFGNVFSDPHVAVKTAWMAETERWEDVYVPSVQDVPMTFEALDAVTEGANEAPQMGKQKVLKRRLKLRRGITVDTGAANNVMPKRLVRNKAKIRPSPGSKRGAHFVAANNGRIPNEGEIDFVFKTVEGHEHSFVFQVAETNKPLGAVSYFVDDGFRVIFDKDLKTGVDLSMMINKATGEITRFRRDRNVWVMDAIIEDEVIAPEGRFHRRA